jgi:hypothetical protein
LVWAKKLSSGYAQKMEHCEELSDLLKAGSYLVRLIDLENGWEETELIVAQ